MGQFGSEIFWQQTVTRERLPALDDTIRRDVAIVGGAVGDAASA